MTRSFNSIAQVVLTTLLESLPIAGCLALLCGASICFAGRVHFNESIHIGTGSDITGNIRFGDIDGDGDQDVITGNGRRNAGQNVVYLNDGFARFSESIKFGTGHDWTYSTDFGDLNDDGWLDIVVGNAAGSSVDSGSHNAVYFGDIGGAFDSPVTIGSPNDQTRGVAIANLNDDPFLDIVVANRAGPNYVYFNDGSGNFLDTQFGTGSDSTINVAVGDMNGDSYDDIVTANRFGEPNVVYFNNGSGDFSATASFGTGSDDTRHVVLGDIDLDGHLDIVAGNTNYGGNIVYFNDGVGGFDRQTRLGTRSGTNELAIGDIDLDGDLDVAIGHGGSSNEVFFNDGTGEFPESVRVGGTNTHSIALGDANGDGFLDLAVGNSHSQNTIYLYNYECFQDCLFDFDGNGTQGIEDADRLALAIREMSNDSQFDVNGDQSIDVRDLHEFITLGNGLDTFVGDANLDARVNATDLNSLALNWQATDVTSWAQGDFTGDGIVNASDLNALALNWQNGTAAAAAAPAAVPEPSSITLLLLGVCAFVRRLGQFVG